MILRIEDTDQGRFVPGAEEYIMESLAWCGIEIDEGIKEGGKYGPYRQSDRKAIYKQYADQLIESGWAYYSFDSAEDLDAIRKEYESRKETFSYDTQTRKTLRNSITLSADEVNHLLNSSFVVADEFEGGAEDAGGMAGKGGADGWEAAGLFWEVGGEIDPVFERAEFEAIDGELVGEGEDLGKIELRAAHRRKAGEEGARVTWRGHRHRG
jgi:hypothetical protein